MAHADKHVAIAFKKPVIPSRVKSKPDQDYAGRTHQCVGAALNEYKTKMVNSNQKFIRDRIDEIYARDLPTERDRLDLMARFWFHKHRWPIKGTNLCEIRHQSPRPWTDPKQIRLEEGVKALKEVKVLHHPYMKGLLPSTLPSMQAVVSVVQALKQLAAEYHEAAGHPYNDGRIFDYSVPLETRYFLLKTDGLCDPDFRYENRCGWSLVDDIERSNIDDPVAFHDDAHNAMRAALVDPAELPVSLHEFLDVIAGVVTGRSTTENGRVGWQSFYLFCRQTTSKTKRTANVDFTWKFCFSPVEEPATRSAVLLPPVFDDVQSLLSWYAAGADSPGLDGRVAAMYDDWDTDSDSAGEAESVAESMGVSRNTRRGRKSKVAITSATVDVRPVPEIIITAPEC